MKLQLGIRGGGVKSITSIGVLAALHDNGIEVSEISGTSIGSVIAALYAAGNEPYDIYQMFKDRLFRLYMTTTRVKGGDGRPIIQETVDEICNKMTISETKIPIMIAANCGGILFPKTFYFDKISTPNVSLGIACQASSSFPILYKRYKAKINGKRIKFYDGGMVANPPVLKQQPEESCFILATFEKEKINKKSLYAHAWINAEEKADIMIKPFVGKMPTVGTAEDVDIAFYLGYEATTQKISLIKDAL